MDGPVGDIDEVIKNLNLQPNSMPDLDNISLMSGDSDRNSTKGINFKFIIIFLDLISSNIFVHSFNFNFKLSFHLSYFKLFRFKIIQKLHKYNIYYN